jgi:hypothetical protein
MKIETQNPHTTLPYNAHEDENEINELTQKL